MDISVINSDPEIMGGTPVFRGTRVPIQHLFDYLERGTLEEFYLDFPTVEKGQVIEVIEIAAKMVNSRNFPTLYESAA